MPTKNDDVFGREPPDAVTETQPATALLADSDAGFRDILRLWLEDDRRWEVEEASDGREALAELDESIDVLVLDRWMPDLAGSAVVERVDDRAFDGPIVVVSASKPDSRLDEAAVSEYLTKPVDRQEFVAALERSLRTAD